MPSPSKPPPRNPLRIETLASVLQQRLESEPQILDLLFGALARGSTNEALWEQLHAAAARDERVSELAFAYERFSNDRKLKGASAAVQAASFVLCILRNSRQALLGALNRTAVALLQHPRGGLAIA